MVREETNQPVTSRPIRAHLRPVSCRVEPALEHSVSVLARVPALASSFPIVWARHGRVVEFTRVSPACFLSRVSERTLGPVVRTSARASLHFEVIHAKVVAGELRTFDVKDGLGRVSPVCVVILVIDTLMTVLLMNRESIHLLSFSLGCSVVSQNETS